MRKNKSAGIGAWLRGDTRSPRSSDVANLLVNAYLLDYRRKRELRRLDKLNAKLMPLNSERPRRSEANSTRALIHDRDSEPQMNVRDPSKHDRMRDEDAVLLSMLEQSEQATSNRNILGNCVTAIGDIFMSVWASILEGVYILCFSLFRAIVFLGISAALIYFIIFIVAPSFFQF